MDNYNTYSGYIQNAAQSYMSGIPRADALLAGLITHESGWIYDKVSPCAAAGLTQMVPGTARGYGLSVPSYDTVPIGSCPQCKADPDRFKAISNCNSCMKNNCDFVYDQRFEPQKVIEAAAKYLKVLYNDCGTVKGAVNKYNSGNSCDSPSDPGYTWNVLIWYETWKTCTEGGVVATTIPGENDYCSDQRVKGQGYCNIGEGGCRGNNECCLGENQCPGEDYAYDIDLDNSPANLFCNANIANGVCCPGDSTNEQCLAGHQAWLGGESDLMKIVEAMQNA